MGPTHASKRKDRLLLSVENFCCYRSEDILNGGPGLIIVDLCQLYEENWQRAGAHTINSQVANWKELLTARMSPRLYSIKSPKRKLRICMAFDRKPALDCVRLLGKGSHK